MRAVHHIELEPDGGQTITDLGGLAGEGDHLPTRRT
jgi:hypothetical protein